jgi:hypothetical protein
MHKCGEGVEKAAAVAQVVWWSDTVVYEITGEGKCGKCH